MKWMVVWVQLMTGQTGHGICVDDKELAMVWAEHGNAEFPDEFLHWVEPCGEDL